MSKPYFYTDERIPIDNVRDSIIYLLNESTVSKMFCDLNNTWNSKPVELAYKTKQQETERAEREPTGNLCRSLAI